MYPYSTLISIEQSILEKFSTNKLEITKNCYSVLLSVHLTSVTNTFFEVILQNINDDIVSFAISNDIKFTHFLVTFHWNLILSLYFNWNIEITK